MRKDLNHREAADYCYDHFNGMLSPFYYSLNEAYEVMGRYFWWPKSDMNVERIRFGVVEDYRDHRNNGTGQFVIQTRFNPVQHLGKYLDMTIWERSFRPEGLLFYISFSNYDEKFVRNALPLANGKDQHVAIRPENRKWSNINIDHKASFVCEVPRFPKIYCEKDWVLHMKSRSCFYLHKKLLSFTGAAMNCRSLKSNLASINEKTENDMVLNMIQETHRVWFGLRHEATRTQNNQQAPPNKKSAAYLEYFAKYLGYNVDGTPVSSTFESFGQNQPDGIMLSSTENCFLFEFDRQWHDYPCDTQAWSVCRKMASTQRYHY
uniref:C-type lectin domain-containing protein n=1 Tax=Panagrolaimus davidi TaxID=227884 RepID=A0A914QVI6_9BILA